MTTITAEVHTSRFPKSCNYIHSNLLENGTRIPVSITDELGRHYDTIALVANRTLSKSGNFIQFIAKGFALEVPVEILYGGFIQVA